MKDELNKLYDELYTLTNTLKGYRSSLTRKGFLNITYKDNIYTKDDKRHTYSTMTTDSYEQTVGEIQQQINELQYKLDNAKEGDVVGEIKVFFENDLQKTIKLVTMNKIDKLIDSKTLEISEILWSDSLDND